MYLFPVLFFNTVSLPASCCILLQFFSYIIVSSSFPSLVESIHSLVCFILNGFTVFLSSILCYLISFSCNIPHHFLLLPEGIPIPFVISCIVTTDSFFFRQLSLLSSPGPPGSSLMEEAVGRWRLVTEVDRRSDGDTRVGDLVRTWCRLVCHALAKVVVLDFRGTEVQRYGGERRHEGGLRVRGWET